MQIKLETFVIVPTTVTAEFTEEDIAELRSFIVGRFLAYVEHANFSTSYLLPEDKAIFDYCTRFGVDGSNKSHRVSFYKSIVAALQ